MNKNTWLGTQVLFVLILFFTVVFIFHKSTVNADYATDYQEYLKIYDNYRVSHDQYLLTRSRYLTYGTQTSENEAFTAVKDFLSLRDDVLISYLNLLKQKTVNPSFLASLEEELQFIQTHKAKLAQIVGLESAVEVSDELVDHDLPLNLVSKKVIGTLWLDEIGTLRLNYVRLESNLVNLIDTLKQQGKDTKSQEQWLREARNRDLLLLTQISQTRTQISELDGRDTRELSEKYDQIHAGILEAHAYLRQALNFLNEATQSIKYGNF